MFVRTERQDADAGKLLEDQLRLAALDAGLADLGENYVQEASGHAPLLAGRAVRRHFIGALQSNKTRPVAESFDWVHTVDRLKIAERLSAQRPAALERLSLGWAEVHARFPHVVQVAVVGYAGSRP